MKPILPIALLLWCCSQAAAQAGVQASWNSLQAPTWSDLLQERYATDPLPATGWHLGLDYWFRLKNRRLEFTPELGFSRLAFQAEEGAFSLQALGFQLHTNLYFLDFDNDCSCPTFSKQGSFLEKGLFLQLSPGWMRWQLKAPTETGETTESSGAFVLGVGVGLDVGVHDLLTLTPFLRWNFVPALSWNALAPQPQPEPASTESTLQMLQLGLRLGLRWKEE